MTPAETLEKAVEFSQYAIEKGWSQEDLYYIAKVILTLFKEN